MDPDLSDLTGWVGFDDEIVARAKAKCAFQAWFDCDTFVSNFHFVNFGIDHRSFWIAATLLTFGILFHSVKFRSSFP